MSRDYKSKGMATTRIGGSLMLGLFIGYALGIASAIGVWVFINQAPSPFLTEEKLVKNKSEESIAQKPRDNNATKEINQASANRPRFDFYNILPGGDESSAEESFDQVMQSPSPILNNTSLASDYFLQIGSYKNASEAERIKAELALLGVFASVQTTHSSERGTWHRVRIGPFAKIDEVAQIRASLQENGIEASFVRVPKSTP